WRWLFDTVNDNDLSRRPGRIQLQSQLLSKRREQVWRGTSGIGRRWRGSRTSPRKADELKFVGGPEQSEVEPSRQACLIHNRAVENNGLQQACKIADVRIPYNQISEPS